MGEARTDTSETVWLGTQSRWIVLLRTCGALAERFSSVECSPGRYRIARSGQSTRQARNCCGGKSGWCVIGGIRAGARSMQRDKSAVSMCLSAILFRKNWRFVRSGRAVHAPACASVSERAGQA